MNNPIAMPDLGNDVYLRFTLRDLISVQFPYRDLVNISFLATAKQRLDQNDLSFILSALTHGLKRADGEYHVALRSRGVPGAIDVYAISVPPSTLTARIYQALQQVIL